jgi:diguanylate cyclase (GGDEF)-like protein
VRGLRVDTELKNWSAVRLLTVWVALDRLLVLASSPKPQEPGFVASWLAPTPLARARVLERSGRVDRMTRVMLALTVGVLVWCVVTLGAWAVVPLVAMLVVLAFGPISVRRGARPEFWDLAAGLLILGAMALAAGMTGGPLSPIAYLLPTSVAVIAMRAVPRATAITTIVAAAVFLVACLLRSPSSVGDHLLGTAALLVTLACVTIASTALAGAEIKYRRASVLDPLTGLLNRQGLEDRFDELRQQAQLLRTPISLVTFDLDHFKAINDQHGHDIGDAILREVAYQVRKDLRAFELVYRMGGEEFLVVLPGMSETHAIDTAEQLRETISHVRVAGEIGVTASLGISSGTGERIDFEPLYRQADEALYAAKQDGRDRTAVWTETDPATATLAGLGAIDAS